MISDAFASNGILTQELLDNLIAFFSVVGASFIGGVIWSAYRAINWVEGIRAWAHAVECDEPVQVPVSVGISSQAIDSRGTE